MPKLPFIFTHGFGKVVGGWGGGGRESHEGAGPALRHLQPNGDTTNTSCQQGVCWCKGLPSRLPHTPVRLRRTIARHIVFRITLELECFRCHHQRKGREGEGRERCANTHALSYRLGTPTGPSCVRSSSATWQRLARQRVWRVAFHTTNPGTHKHTCKRTNTKEGARELITKSFTLSAGPTLQSLPQTSLCVRPLVNQGHATHHR